ncbi:hypothetical protein KSF73_00205 [Burkholderiaceae bacterium DAT-1]|nr:hypothetical protein [Burkholderiaceae bacterium DAT-1]
MSKEYALSMDGLALLSRALKVNEGEKKDTVELVSPWQRLPEFSPVRLHVRIGAGFVALVVLLMTFQGVIAHQLLPVIAAVFILLGGVLFAWQKRFWFWAAILEVDADTIRLVFRGPGAPAASEMRTNEVDALVYRMNEGRLARLAIQSGASCLKLPFSGRHDVDKLYCNLIRHFLQKHKPDIEFKQHG